MFEVLCKLVYISKKKKIQKKNDDDENELIILKAFSVDGLRKTKDSIP